MDELAILDSRLTALLAILDSRLTALRDCIMAQQAMLDILDRRFEAYEGRLRRLEAIAFGPELLSPTLCDGSSVYRYREPGK